MHIDDQVIRRLVQRACIQAASKSFNMMYNEGESSRLRRPNGLPTRSSLKPLSTEAELRLLRGEISSKGVCLG